MGEVSSHPTVLKHQHYLLLKRISCSQEFINKEEMIQFCDKMLVSFSHTIVTDGELYYIY